MLQWVHECHIAKSDFPRFPDDGYTMQSPLVIELNEEPPSFNEDEWTGKGRQYPKEEHAPLALKFYIDGLLTIPDTGEE